MDEPAAAHWIGSGVPVPENVVPPASEDSRVEKWKKQLENEIRDEILSLFHYRDVYRRVVEMINTRQPELPESVFVDMVWATYAITQAAAVRRQADTGPRVVSLARLLTEISGDSERLTRDRFVGGWPPRDQERGSKLFADRFAGQVGTYLDPNIASADIKQLSERVAAIVEYVDKHVAHTDRKPVKELPTFDDLNAAIEMIGEMFKKYHLLLTGNSYVKLEPAIQQNWEAIFRMPWIA